ncbi:MAG TPA: glycosyltransferase family 2 protein, partial [Anaerolineae bacterium]|nr:glycosyltransferase family 2 protein [Anaerolineae bacterium]
MPTNEPTIADYVQRVGRKLLATEGPAIAPLPANERARGVRARAGTSYWRYERAAYRFILRHEAGIQRLLVVLLGIASWGLIALPFALGRQAPAIPVVLALLYQVYWLGRGLGTLVYGGVGCLRVRVHRRIDWRARYEAERAAGGAALPWKKIRHIVVISNYSEPVAKLRATLEALAAQREVASQLWVVLAMEGREEGAAAKARALQAEFAGRLGDLRYTLHPAGLPGEVPGKAANEAWAARWARRHYVDELGHDIHRITLTSCDVDSVFDPGYFACLTYKFATDPARQRRIWQAPVFFHNNAWQVPTFIRFLGLSLAVWQLADLTSPLGDPHPISTYSISLATLDGAGYWDPGIVTEDWHIYFKCFFRYRGRISIEPIYLPVSADATLSTSLARTATVRYEQAKRHGWGTGELLFGAVKMAFRHAEIPAHVKMPPVLMLAREHILWSTSWFVLTLGL